MKYVFSRESPASGSLVFCLVFLFLFFVSKDCFGQGSYTWKKFTIHHVVPENHLKQILKDQNGFYWIVTGSGRLIRWNGSNGFRVFDKLPITKGIPIVIGGCLPGRTGKLFFSELNSRRWIETSDNSHIQLSDTVFSGTSPSMDYAGNFFAIRENKEFIRKFNTPALVNSFLTGAGNNADYLHRIRFTTLSNGNYLLGNNDIFFYHKGHIRKWDFPDPNNKGGLIVGEFLLLRNQNNFELYKQGELAGKGLITHLPKLPVEHETGVIRYCITPQSTYIASGDTIFKLTVQNNKLDCRIFFHSPNIRQIINCFYVDESTGKVIIADWNGGFTVYERNLYHYNEKKNNISYNVVYSLFTKSDKVWQSKDLLLKIHPRGLEEYAWTAPVIPLPDGHFIYPTIEGIVHFDKSFRVEKKKSFKFNSILKSAALMNGTLFLASDRLLRYYPATGKLDTFRFAQAELNNTMPGFICKGPENILFAAMDSFIYAIDIQKNAARKLSEKSLITGVRGWRSLIYSERYKGLFFTMEGQIGFLSLHTGKMYELPLGDSKDLAACHYVLEDGDGDCWLPTNNGLYLLTGKQLQNYLRAQSPFLSYQALNIGRDGEQEEFNGGFSNGGICVGDSVFLSSMHGVVSFPYAEAKNSLGATVRSKILLDEVFVDDVLVSATDKIYLPAGFKRCEVAVDFPFSNLPGGTIEYQLTGIRDTSFELVPQNSRILLRGLTPGKYRLRVGIISHPEVEPLEITLFVSKYWYNTKAAYAGYAVLIAALLFMLLNWRIKSIQNRTLREIDQSRSEMFTIISHDLRSPLKAYQGLADVVSYLLKNKEYDKIEKVAANIDSTGAKLDLLLDNLLNWNLLQQEKLHTYHEQIELSSLVKDHLEIYNEIAVLKSIQIEAADLQAATIYSARDMVSLILRNLLDNAIKNAPQQSFIGVAMKNQDNQIAITVTNQITEKSRPLLERVRQLLMAHHTAWEPGTRGMGIGLKMVQLAAMKIGGTLTMSMDDIAVNFTIQINK